MGCHYRGDHCSTMKTLLPLSVLLKTTTKYWDSRLWKEFYGQCAAVYIRVTISLRYSEGYLQWSK